ncbi:MAG: hypothetical protein GYB67_13765 [Chloroflexi bacterium]|nr:hypothetical protein [Chloroflexota bacterium]
MKPTLNQLHQELLDIHTYRAHRDWLTKAADSIYATIRAALQEATLINAAVDTLLDVITPLLEYDAGRWRPLLDEAQALVSPYGDPARYDEVAQAALQPTRSPLSDLPRRLRDVRLYNGDAAWLAENEDEIRELIAQGLHFGPAASEAAQTLLLVGGFMLKRENHRAWRNLIFDMLPNTRQLLRNIDQVRLLNLVAQAALNSSEPRLSDVALQQALDRAADDASGEALVEAHIQLLQHIAHSDAAWADDQLRPEQIAYVRRLAADLDDLRLSARLYQSLAVAYAHWGRTPAALGYGQVAYAYWQRLNDVNGLAETAGVLAETARLAELPRLAEHYLQLAIRYNDDLPTSKVNTARLANWRASMLYEQEQYEEAENWYAIGLVLFRRLGLTQYMAISAFGLGMAQVQRGKFEQARANLHAAERAADKLESRYHKVNVQFAFGYLEAKRGNHREAQRLLHAALQQTDTLADMQARQAMRAAIRDVIQKLDSGGYAAAAA